VTVYAPLKRARTRSGSVSVSGSKKGVAWPSGIVSILTKLERRGYAVGEEPGRYEAQEIDPEPDTDTDTDPDDDRPVTNSPNQLG